MQSRDLAEKYLKKVRALRSDASWEDVFRIEQESRKAVFDLINSSYVELIFQINTTFARKHFTHPSASDHTEEHRVFVRAWRHAKLLEFESIVDGDPELAMLAARHARNVWHRRIWNHDKP